MTEGWGSFHKGVRQDHTILHTMFADACPHRRIQIAKHSRATPPLSHFSMEKTER